MPRLSFADNGGGRRWLRFRGVPTMSYRLQRAPASTGPWIPLDTLTAPASGLLEYHDATPPPSQAFYRTVQP